MQRLNKIIPLVMLAGAALTAQQQMFYSLPPVAAGFNGFSHYVISSINHTLVPSDQANYIWTVDHTDTHLKTVANGGYVTCATGCDIGFYSDPCITKLSWDALQVYDGTAGHVVASVQVGTASSTVDTPVYICAGNGMITTFQGGSTGAAWPATYRDVKHFSKNGSLDLADYTTNGNSGTGAGNIASSTSCPFGQCASSSTGGSVKTSASSGFSNGTVEMWIFPTSTACCATFFDTQANGYQIYLNAGKINCASDSNATMVQSTTALTVNTWSHIVCSWNGTGTVAYVYINGVLDNSATSGIGSLASWSNLLYMEGTGGANLATGRIAEARVINAYMNTAARPLTDYNNQVAPDTFAPWGVWH